VKVLLDENLPHQLRTRLPGHEVSTAQYLGWSGMKNGELLRSAELSGFQCLVTSDQNLSYQQNLADRSIAVITLTRQKWAILKDHLYAIQAAVDRA